MDAAFIDEELFKTCECKKIGKLCGCKLYDNVRQTVEKAEDWQTYISSVNQDIWQFTEFKS